MSQITCLLKAVYEIKNEEAIHGMHLVRAAVWAKEEELKKITQGNKKEEEKDFQIPKVPESWITE